MSLRNKVANTFGEAQAKFKILEAKFYALKEEVCALAQVVGRIEDGLDYITYWLPLAGNYKYQKVFTLVVKYDGLILETLDDKWNCTEVQNSEILNSMATLATKVLMREKIYVSLDKLRT